MYDLRNRTNILEIKKFNYNLNEIYQELIETIINYDIFTYGKVCMKQL